MAESTESDWLASGDGRRARRRDGGDPSVSEIAGRRMSLLNRGVLNVTVRSSA